MASNLADGTVRGEDSPSSSLTIGHDTQDVLNHASEQLTTWPLSGSVPNSTLRVQFAPTPNNTSAETTSVDDLPRVRDIHTTDYVNQVNAGQEASEASADRAQEANNSQMRSSFEIMGCLAPNNVQQPIRGVGPNLSRPPSSMPDFGFVGHSNAPQPVPQTASHLQENSATNSIVHFSMALTMVFISGSSAAAAVAVCTSLGQVGKPVTAGHKTWLALSIVFFLLASAGLGHVLCSSPQVLTEIPRRARAFPWGVHWPQLRLQHIHWPRVHWPAIRVHRPFQSGSQSSQHLPRPKEFELADFENQPPRPPTPYPGTNSTEAFPQGRPQTLPLGFPAPPTASVRRINSRVSRMSSTSFRSDPRSVSPLSDVPPAPPPKDPGFSRFQSQEPLLPPTVSGDTVAQSDTRASILTTLCDAVQLSNPDNEPGREAQNYSPLAMASSPATGTTSGNSGPIQSPKPTYPIELASPSRGKERED